MSLPTSIVPSKDHDEALAALRATVTDDYGTVTPFPVPAFKIGSLDALVQQADDLAKLEASCEGIVSKVGDSLKTILEGDEGKVSQQKTVNDSTELSYISNCIGLCLPFSRTRGSVSSDVYVAESQVQGGQASCGDYRYATESAYCLMPPKQYAYPAY